jgi:mannosyl-oligosaccharide glucosidase
MQTVMSGMDDYPRASHPSKDERHLDLHCWMAFASQTMAKIASLVDISSHTKYRDTAAWLTDLKLLNELYYEERLGRYFDFGNHSEMIKLYQKTTVEPRTGYVHSEVRRLVMELPELRWVPQYGYNSLFPLVFRMFPLVSSIK